MRHRVEGKKFHRMRGQRRAFMRSLANSLIRTGHIETTVARAKAVRPVVEKLVTLAKKQDLASRRLISARLHDPKTVKQLFDTISPRYADRAGGYLRVRKLMKHRKRDNAPVAIVEFV